MTIQAEVEILEGLSKLDQSLAGLLEELGRERTALEGKRQKLKELQARVASAAQGLQEMDRTRSELLTEVRQMSVQLDRSREKLSRCRTEREANAAQREVEEMRKLYRDREQEIEKLASISEQGKLELEKTTAERDKLEGELGANEGTVTTHLTELERRSKLIEDERKALVSGLNVVLYRRYELVRKRRGSAIAYTSDGICSACHVRIAPMMFHTLMRGTSFEQCPNCNRILYYREPGSAAAAEPQESSATHDSK
ncbi:MAG: C4-type zinc ribbon domain-containing protein [Polyangiaceae bacterium]|nr:C4-type zinc ribbon domain-containing protein [Polyangiaceae bacterium]